MTVGIELQPRPDARANMKLGRLGDHVEILSGFAFDSSRFANDGEMPLIRIRDVVRGRTETYYSGQFDERFVVREGDLLVGMDGDFNRETWSSEPALLNQRVCRISPRDTHLDRRYLYHFLPQALMEIWHATPFATVKHLSVKAIREITLPLPPLDEQRRIAAILDKADELRTKRRQALAQLALLPQSIFIDMFGDPITNDSRLPVEELQTLLDKTRPLTYGILMPGPDQENGVKYIRVTDIQKGRIQESTVRSTTSEISEKYRRSTLRPGDLLMSIRGHVGRFAVVPPSLDGANITQDTARLAVSGAEVTYVRECLSTPGFQRWMVRHTKGVAVRGINLGDVRRMPIPVPSAEKQQFFARRIEAIERLQDHGRAQLADLDGLFAALQYRAFQGEL